MNQKPFDLTLINFEDHDPPSAFERSFERRRHLSSPTNIEGLDETQPPSTVHR